MSHTLPYRTPPAGRTSVVRVASIPAGHVYVQHLRPVPSPFADAPTVRWLADPAVADPAAPRSPGRPPRMLEPQWISEHADDFDVCHVHFGFDVCTVDDLHEFVAALHAAGKPLVCTVHDLRNPDHLDRSLHESQLDVLIRSADALVTLTPGAAAAIHARWGRTARVIPHPHVVDFATMDRARARWSSRGQGTLRVGLHVKSLQPCMDPVAVLPGLVRAVEELPDAVLQVDGHRDVLERGGRRYDRDLASMLASLDGRIDLRVGDHFGDEDLWAYLESLDASVLAYRFGTHSRWLETCRDLGTAVVAPSCGYYADQGPVHTYVLDETRHDEQSLVDAVQAALTAPVTRLTVRERVQQRTQIAHGHHELYHQLLADR